LNKISTDELRKMDGEEGLILQGCGGDPQDWITGINEMLTKERILRDGSSFKSEKVSRLFSTKVVTCLLFPIDDSVRLDMGKLAIWRLKTHDAFGGTWLSDYVPNRSAASCNPIIKVRLQS
jgi:hypothetical protein